MRYFRELDNDCCSALAYNLGNQRGRVGPSPLRRRHLLGLRLLSELRLQGRTHTTAAGITQIIMSMTMRHIHTTVPITEAAIIIVEVGVTAIGADSPTHLNSNN